MDVKWARGLSPFGTFTNKKVHLLTSAKNNLTLEPLISLLGSEKNPNVWQL